jgi:hypothetical protein
MVNNNHYVLYEKLKAELVGKTNAEAVMIIKRYQEVINDLIKESK